MKKSYLKITFVAVFFNIATAFSQNVGINTSGSSPSQNAILDLNTGNSNNLGLIIPNVTLGASLTTFSPPILNAATANDIGMLVYNKLATNQPIGYYYWNGATWVSIASGGSSGWAITGNAGTTPGTNYAGTSDANAFVIKTNGLERMRFLAGGGAGIGTPTPQSSVDVNGSMSIGAYAGVTAAPGNGVIISGQVGIGTSSPNASAALDVSSTSAGLLPPRMSAAQMNAIVAPAAGLIVLNTNTNCLEFWSGTAWQNIVCPCSGPPATPGVITGNATPCASSAGNVYSIVAVSGATSYTWSLPAGAIITAGTGTNTITVTFGTASGNISVTASNSCGTSAASILAVNVLTTPAAPATPSGNTSPLISTAYTYTIPTVSGATTYTWSVSTTNGTVTAGQGTTSATITFSGTPATMNICVTAGNACFTSPPTCLSVTSTSCIPAATLDTYVNALSATSFNITTVQANEIIVIYAIGWPSIFTGSATVDGNPATLQLAELTGNSSGSAELAYLAPAAGSHTIIINESGYSGYYSNFAFAIKGNACSNLSVAKTTVSGAATNSLYNVSATIITPSANCYLLVGGSSNMSTCGAYIGFTGAITSVLASNVVPSCVEGAVGNIAEPVAGPYTVTNTNTNPSYPGETIIVTSVQP
jgi:hypothetical protein